MASIVHIGVGRFHRAHEALYVNDLLEQQKKEPPSTSADSNIDWHICGVCILPFDKFIFDKLSNQKGKYHLIERSGTDEVVKEINSISEVLFGYEDPAAVFTKLQARSTKLVTFTVTEAGYFYDTSTQTLNEGSEHVQFDVSNPSTPHTLYGYLARGLHLRLKQGLAPFTVQSCDNIQGNGDLVKKLLLQFCTIASYPEVAEWISSGAVAFPNSMVDRITPAASAAEATYVKDVLQLVDDEVPVTCESYRTWVVEDKYCNDRPDWTQVGVTLVDSVKPYEKIKVRLLNGGHSAIGYAGFLAGFSRIDQVASNEVFQRYLRAYFRQTSVTLTPVAGIDLPSYHDSLVSRFANPAIEDQVLRICKDGSAKIPGFILPTLAELVKEGYASHCVSFVVASWIRFLHCICLPSSSVVPSSSSSPDVVVAFPADIDDPEKAHLREMIVAANGQVGAFLCADDKMFNFSVIAASFPALVDEIQDLYDSICRTGVTETMLTVLAKE